MKSNAEGSEKKPKVFEVRKCGECGAIEGEKSKNHESIITLARMNDNENRGEKLVCQVCIKSEIKNHKRNINNKVMEKLRSYITVLFGMFVFILITSSYVIAQPGLPGNPDQAPIDGGLGLLAAAGGAYAFKKLRSKEK